jgi:predicted nucleic acid-binding protein
MNVDTNRLGRVFVDTNIFVYSVDPTMGTKFHRSKSLLAELMADGRLVISTQIVREFSNVYLKNVAVRDVSALIDLIDASLAPYVETSENVRAIKDAIFLTIGKGISFYDGLILQAAADLGCSTLYSEDFQHGRVYSGVEVVNPFL